MPFDRDCIRREISDFAGLVDKHIAYIEEVRQARQAPTCRGMPRPVATRRDMSRHLILPQRKPRRAATGSSDKRRPVATCRDSRTSNASKSENEFLRGQIGVKDEQIKDLTERARETNHLIAGLQKMLTPLLGRPEDPRTDPR